MQPAGRKRILLIVPARHGIDRTGNCRPEARFFELGAGPALALLDEVMEIGNCLLVDRLDSIDDTAAMLDVGSAGLCHAARRELPLQSSRAR